MYKTRNQLTGNGHKCPLVEGEALMPQMPRWLVAPALLLAFAAMAQQQELTAADHSAIHTVIEHQLEAFRNDDAAGAFAFASPAIQTKFGTPEQFMSMVQTAYPPVYRPRHVAFKELRQVQGVPTQEVLLVGPDGVPVMALYMLQKQPDGAWKIDGCYLMSFKGERL
jgi:hypothetical protein